MVAARQSGNRLRKVFEASPIQCPCGAEMVPVAMITQDGELKRLLAHLDLPTEFPKANPARSSASGAPCAASPSTSLGPSTLLRMVSGVEPDPEPVEGFRERPLAARSLSWRGQPDRSRR